MIPLVTASEEGKAQHRSPCQFWQGAMWCLGGSIRALSSDVQVPLTGAIAR